MAADWIKIECTTPDKPEVHSLAQTLGLTPDEVMGKLVRIWSWADANVTDGTVKRICNATVTAESIVDRIANVSGFAKALINVGWMRVESDAFLFPNFDRHNGNPAKKRAETNRRVKRFRNAENVTDALPEREKENNNSIVSSKKKRNARESYSDSFERFWNAYPSKGRSSKAKAMDSWLKAIGQLNRLDAEEFLIRRASDYASSPKAKTEFVKHATSWLNQACWEDSAEAWALSDPKREGPTANKSAYEDFDELERAERARAAS